MSDVWSSIKRSLVIFMVTVSSHAVAGGSFDLSLSDDTIRASYDATKVGTGLHVGLDVLHHSDDGDIGSIGAHVVDIRDNNSDLYIGIGGKLYGFKTRGDTDFSGLAAGLGGFYRYRLPGVPETSLSGYLYYAPPVVSGGDAANLFDGDVRLQYNIIPTARIYLGYRYTGIRIKKAQDRFRLGDGFHLGMKVDF